MLGGRRAAGRRAHGGRGRAPRRVASSTSRTGAGGASPGTRRSAIPPPTWRRSASATSPTSSTSARRPGTSRALAAGARRARRAAGRRPPRRDRPAAPGARGLGRRRPVAALRPRAEGGRARGLARQARRAFLPSRAEVEHLAPDRDWRGLVGRLREAGFQEVVVKLGDAGCLVAGPGSTSPCAILRGARAVADLTGAGDAFCGAYAAARARRARPGGGRAARRRSPRRWWSSAPAPPPRSPCRAPRPSVGWLRGARGRRSGDRDRHAGETSGATAARRPTRAGPVRRGSRCRSCSTSRRAPSSRARWATSGTRAATRWSTRWSGPSTRAWSPTSSTARGPGTGGSWRCSRGSACRPP